MGKVDGKAGVAPRGAEANLLGFDQDHLVVRVMQGQLARSGKPGETRAKHHPARLAPPPVRGAWLARRAEVEPAATVVVRGGRGVSVHGILSVLFSPLWHWRPGGDYDGRDGE
ncbi:hypothetical protein D3C75_1152340 [compost metagenome]